MKKHIQKITWLAVVFMMFVSDIYGQGPTNIPKKHPDPLPMTLPNILLFFVLPAGLLVFYIWWLKQKRKEREELKEHEEKNKE